MPESIQNPPSPQAPILSSAEAGRRAALLTALQEALTDHGVSSVIARTHRLVLKSSGPFDPSGPTDPRLHIFALRGTDIATTDGTAYHFASGRTHPADDPAGAAVLAHHYGHKHLTSSGRPATTR